jgi:predicted nucleic acid-binding protein
VPYLLDTNILLRSIEPGHPMHAEAVEAVALLLSAGETVGVLPQNIAEFWNVCTRPAGSNGLGLSAGKAAHEVNQIESILDVFPDRHEAYDRWKEIVVKHSVLGVKVHDARIAAAMNVHNIENIVTFNDKDFRRYQGITAFTPQKIITLYTP